MVLLSDTHFGQAFDSYWGKYNTDIAKDRMGQLLSAGVIAFYGQILLSNITFFGINLEFGVLSYPITILFIIDCASSFSSNESRLARSKLHF